MVKRWLILLLAAMPLMATAQEVLLPLQHATLEPRRAPKTATAAVSLPFFDDFAAGFDATLWETAGGVTATMDVSPLAPTVGVATLDALDAVGDLYLQANTSLFTADTLTSMPLRLDSLTSADSVVFSFHYLPGGGFGNMWERVGDVPDPQDSLFLDFYRPSDSTWVVVWCCGGICVDTLMARTGSAWQFVMVPVTDSAFFDSTFRFRFRNHASLEGSPKAGLRGNCDFWHLDCIHLDRGRDTAIGSVTRDVAFAAPAPSMLSVYRAMPYRQYTAADMAAALDMKIVNRYSSPLASHYEYAIYDTLGNELNHYDGGFENAPSGELQTFAPHARPSVNYSFPAMTGATEYDVVHTIREGTVGDSYPRNDTVRYSQHFGDYYAYDDGSAENGYGLTSTASRLYLAYRFDLRSADTLTAVDLFFNKTLDDGNATIPFYLTVWTALADGRPGEVVYRDTVARLARFGGYQRYVLENPAICDGSIFVGFEQIGNDYINLGFDRSLNTAERIWYLTGTEWQQSILSGSLMLRPAFGVAATVGIPDVENSKLKVEVYPNPANEMVYIGGLPTGTRIELYDTFGRRVYTGFDSQFSVLNYPRGLYLLRAIAPSGAASTVKLVIKH